MSIESSSIILVKPEPVYGVYTAPDPLVNAIEVFNYRPNPLESEEVRKQTERAFPGRNRAGRTAKRARDPFDIYMTGGGAVDAIPRWAPLLQIAMFGAPVVAEDVDVTYPLTDVGDGNSISLLSFRGKLARMRRRGVRGNITMDFTERGYPILSVDPIGLLEGPVTVDAAAAPDVVFDEDEIGPVEVSMDNTAVLLGGQVLHLKSLRFNWGMKTTYYSTTGSKAVIFDKGDDGDRRSISAVARFEMPNPATKNYFAELDSDVPQAFSLTHGVTPGNIISLTSARTFVENIELNPESNKEFLDCTLGFVPSAANNELTLKTR